MAKTQRAAIAVARHSGGEGVGEVEGVCWCHTNTRQEGRGGRGAAVPEWLPRGCRRDSCILPHTVVYYGWSDHSALPVVDAEEGGAREGGGGGGRGGFSNPAHHHGGPLGMSRLLARPGAIGAVAGTYGSKRRRRSSGVSSSVKVAKDWEESTDITSTQMDHLASLFGAQKDEFLKQRR